MRFAPAQMMSIAIITPSMLDKIIGVNMQRIPNTIINTPNKIIASHLLLEKTSGNALASFLILTPSEILLIPIITTHHAIM